MASTGLNTPTQVTLAKLNRDDEHDSGNSWMDEGQPDRPARAQCSGGEHDLVLAEPSHEWARQS